MHSWEMPLRRFFVVIICLTFVTYSKANFATSMMCADTLDIDIITTDVDKGDSVCVELVISGFNNVNSLQFSITWDPSVLEFSSIHDVNPGNTIGYLIEQNFGLFTADQGVIRFLWFDNDVDGETAPDNFVMARLCFKAVGGPGDMTEIAIGDIPLKFEAQDPDGESFCLEDDGQSSVMISLPTDFCVISKACASRTNMGSFMITPFGGMPPYSVSIPSLGIANDMIGSAGEFLTYNMLNPGTYTVIVEDASGNDTTMMLQIFNEEPLTIDTLELRTISCADENDGRIEIAIDGGVEPYTYTWDPIRASGQTRLTRLPGGFYTVTVKDSLGCSATATFDLDADVLAIDTNVLVKPSCPGREDGTLQVIPTGGQPYPGGTYDFRWSQNPAANGRGTMSTNNMVGGQGYVVVEDDAGCIDTLFYNLDTDAGLTATIEIDSVQCHGDSTGGVRIVPSSDSPTSSPYQFLIFRESGPIVPGGVIIADTFLQNNLWAGIFRLTLEDSDGCILRDTFEIEEPEPFEMIIVDADTSAGCGGMTDAFIEVSGFMGNGGPFTYQWDYQNAMTPRIDNLTGGQYTVTVTDRKGCEAVRTFDVTGNVGPTISGFDIQDVGCVGDTTGRITVLYQEGDTTISTITWSNGRSGETIQGLSDGTYIVTITDDNGCESIDTAVVNVPPTSLQITSFIVDTPSCNGSFDGFLQIFVNGGSGNYVYQWSNNTTDSVLTNIGAGRYIVAVRDESNCPPIIDTFDIPEPPAVNINILDLTPVSCNDDTTCNGIVIASASGGPDPSQGYNFIWSSGEFGQGVQDTANMMCKGGQLLIVANGDCVDSMLLDIQAPPALGVNFASSQIERPSCAGFDDGSISIVSQGGTGTRRVRWDFGPTADQLTNLPSGVYAFIVEDDNGCLYRDSIVLNDPDSLDAFILNQASREITCNGDTDGRLVVSWRGGNDGAATFDWSPMVSSDSIASELSAGTYFITVTDAKGCIDSVSYTLDNPPAILADFPVSDSVNCFGGQLPVTIIGAMGGNGPDFTFSINNGPRRNLGEEVNLFAGTYTISVFDKDGCRIDSMVSIYQPTEFNVDLGPDVVEVNLGDSLQLCYQTNIGSNEIDSTIWIPLGRPSDPNFRCIWLTPIDDLTAQVTLIDRNGCEATDEVDIQVNKNRKVFVPNVFNPNGNVNTTWQIFTGTGVRKVNKIAVYDRWGELIYQNLDPQPSQGWNGTFQGTNELVPNGVYVYVVEVEYLDNAVEIRRGDVTIIR